MRAWGKGSRSFLVAALVAASGCSDGGGGETVAPVPTTPPPATTSVATTAVPPPTTTPVSEVPAVIDAPYVERVMTVLDTIEGEAVKELVTNRKTTDRFQTLLQATYANPGYLAIQEVYSDHASNGLGRLKREPGRPATTVRQVVDSSPNCIVAQIKRNFEDVLVDATPGGQDGYVQLRTRTKPYPESVNPTAWKIVNAIADDEQAKIPADPCK